MRWLISLNFSGTMHKCHAAIVREYADIGKCINTVSWERAKVDSRGDQVVLARPLVAWQDGANA